jgi:hypothetical protein
MRSFVDALRTTAPHAMYAPFPASRLKLLSVLHPFHSLHRRKVCSSLRIASHAIDFISLTGTWLTNVREWLLTTLLPPMLYGPLTEIIRLFVETFLSSLTLLFLFWQCL